MEGQEYTFFITRIRERYGTFSASQRAVADYVTADLERAMTATVTELAAQTGVSVASVIRFCKACGFSGLPEMRSYLKHERDLAAGNRGLSQVKDPGNADEMIKDKVLGLHQIAARSMSGWDRDAYAAAVERILQAGRILVIGQGGSKASAVCMCDYLMQIHLPAEIAFDPIYEILKADALSPEDVVIAFTMTGKIRDTLDSLRTAKERGACTIGIIGDRLSPAAECSDIILDTKAFQMEFYDGIIGCRASEMIVVDILYALLAVRVKARAEGWGHVNDAINMKRVK